MKKSRGWKLSLSTQLVVLFTMALLPLGLISLYQTWVVAQETDRLAARALMAEAENAAAAERKLLYEAIGSAEVIASAVGQGKFDVDFCTLLTQQFIASQDVFVWAGVVERNGSVRCSSNKLRLLIPDNDELMVRAESQTRGFFSRKRGRASGQSVLVAYAPTFNEGELLGLTAVSLPHDIANSALADASEGMDFSMTTLNRDGEILSSSVGLEAAESLLPEELTARELIDRVDTTFEALSASGKPHIYAVTDLIDDEVVLLGARPVVVSDSFFQIERARMALIFPLIMWVVSLAVALFGLNRLVLRHIKELRSAMRRFALGERDDPLLELVDAPPELEEAQRAFNRMVMILSEAEARTLKDLQEKTILLREVHHRVKNNLQMVASIMNLQMRKAQSEEARQVLAQLQNRVRGLATIHRSLFTTPELATVNGAELVSEMIEEIGVSYFAKTYNVDLTTDLSEVPLYPDQAVPLSMFLSEAMTNAIKYVGKPVGEAQASINIRLSLEGDMIRLSIENTLGDPVPGRETLVDPSGGLGARLMQAFVSQLNGDQKVEKTDTSYLQEVCFRVQDSDANPETPPAVPGKDPDQSA